MTRRKKANLALTPEQLVKLTAWQANVGGARACGTKLSMSEVQYRSMARGNGVRVSLHTAELLAPVVGPVELVEPESRTREVQPSLNVKPSRLVHPSTRATIADAIARFGVSRVAAGSCPAAVVTSAANGFAVSGGHADALDWYAASRPDAFGFEGPAEVES